MCAPDLDPDVLLLGMPFSPCKDSYLERRSEVSSVSALNFVLSVKWTTVGVDGDSQTGRTLRKALKVSWGLILAAQVHLQRLVSLVY